MRITSAQQIADLLGKDVLIRALVEFIRITPAAKIQPLPGACIFISQLPEIQDFDAIWTLRVTGLEGEELGDIIGAIQALIGGSIQGSQVTVVSFASTTLIKEVEAYQQQQEIQNKLDQVVQTAMSVKDGRDGSQGAQGERGERGERGEQGPMGPAGRDGRDGQDIDATQTELFDLKDVEQGIAQEKGQVLTWDGSKWTNLFVPQLMSSIFGEVGNGTTSLPSGDYANQPLTWDGSAWVPGSSIQLDTNNILDPEEGELTWEQDEHTAILGINGIHAHLAHDTYAYCRNNSGATITKGTAVQFAGTLGASGRLLVAPMVANGSQPGYAFLGIAAEDILNDSDGSIISYGKLKGLDTTGYTAGSILWCDPATPGGLTTTEPSAPNLKLPVAAVISSANNGTLMIRWSTGDRLQDLHDVEANGSKQNGDVLTWVAANNRWEAKVPSGGGGGIEEAPQDGNYYVRQNGAWVNLTTALAAIEGGIIDGGDFETGSSSGNGDTIDGGDFGTGSSSGGADTIDGGIFT